MLLITSPGRQPKVEPVATHKTPDDDDHYNDDDAAQAINKKAHDSVSVAVSVATQII